MSIYTIQATFSRGELSPRLHSRTDIEHWRMGLEKCRNFFVMRQGGLMKRQGTYFAGEVKDSSKKTRLAPFTFSTEQAYMMELGENYARFYANGGRLEDGGSPVEVTTPYTETQLFDIQYTQSADTFYCVHNDHPQATIVRTSAVDFTYSPIAFSNAPSDWSANDYPGTVAFFQERLAFAATKTKPQTAWLSKSGILEDYGTSTPLVADDAITVTILAGEVNAITWMAEGQDLLIGTSGAARTLGPSDRGLAFSATNLRQQRQTRKGAASIQPVQIGNVALYVSRFRDRIHEYMYSFEADGYVAPELTVLSEHILKKKVVEIAYAQDPESVNWIALETGELAALTYDREQQVIGITLHQIAGVDDEIGFVESVKVIPGSFGDEVWMIVRRNINGALKRYVEYFVPHFDYGDNIADAFYVDSGLTHDGAATNVVSGLDHLEGCTVQILADGAVEPEQVVSGGQIALQDGKQASKIHVGLGYKAEGKTLPSAVSRGDGSGYARPKKVSSAIVDLLYSGPLKVKGGEHSDFETIGLREDGDIMDAPPPLRTGPYNISIDSSWEDKGQIEFKSDLPLPCIIRSLTLNLDTAP